MPKWGLRLAASHAPIGRSVTARISIDRRHHLELAWLRQSATQDAIAQELQRGPQGAVWLVRDMAHLEAIHDATDGQIVVICAFSRSCGCCKHVLRWWEDQSKEAQWSKAGVVHCKHNVVNEFDYSSDLARWYQVKHVPSFLFFVNGSLVDRIVLTDSRTRAYGPRREIEKVLAHDLENRVKQKIRQLVFRRAPSASSSERALKP